MSKGTTFGLTDIVETTEYMEDSSGAKDVLTIITTNGIITRVERNISLKYNPIIWSCGKNEPERI
jgi:hypothetical protein